MNFEQPTGETLNINEARIQIEALRAEIMQMGANDSENSSIDGIISRLDNREITPEEAVAEARGIRDSKQAYH